MLSWIIRLKYLAIWLVSSKKFCTDAVVNSTKFARFNYAYPLRMQKCVRGEYEVCYLAQFFLSLMLYGIVALYLL